MEGEPTEAPRRRAANGLGLLAVQSISCAVLVLTVLILRLVGGGVFAQLQRYFHEAIRQNALAAAIHALFEEEIPYTEPETESASDQIASEAAHANASVSLPTAPVSGAVLTSGYGDRENPFGGGTEFHSGVDFAAEVGTPVVAMWDGEVIEAHPEEDGSLGCYVRLRHAGGLEVLYAHCETVCPAGTIVSAGETVATLGNTGRSTGAHLHVEIWQNDTLCDPARFFSGDV